MASISAAAPVSVQVAPGSAPVLSVANLNVAFQTIDHSGRIGWTPVVNCSPSAPMAQIQG